MTPATARRHQRALQLARDIGTWLDRSVRGENLRQRLVTSGPADIETTDQGAVVRCYGLQTPPCRNTQAAIVTWSRMAEQLFDNSLSKRS
ncbi:hypothetical protein J7426_14445 [Tropicibacter sp. R16_0]|uniref:hypothetical protein n=1 Tax=Tropicibacter sp. R16_0 TaxID=2821102 RepID=UPI001ADA1790|nr:hypothetical protein [Tropicibacter sp. R16_0]MBO9451470.1 hypothetical protein [Tropicibacter sp. R16_0]